MKILRGGNVMETVNFRSTKFNVKYKGSFNQGILTW